MSTALLESHPDSLEVIARLKDHPREAKGAWLDDCLAKLFKNDMIRWSLQERLDVFAAYVEAWGPQCKNVLRNYIQQDNDVARAPLTGPTWSQIGPDASYKSPHDWYPNLIQAVITVWPEAIDCHIEQFGQHPLVWLRSQTSPGTLGGLKVYLEALQAIYETSVVVEITASRKDDLDLMITCTSVAGVELIDGLTISADAHVSSLKRTIAEQLGLPRQNLSLYLPNSGSVLTEADEEKKLHEVLVLQ